MLRLAAVGSSIELRLRSGRQSQHGGTPYGASTIAAGDGSRQPGADELEIARHQGAHVAQITIKLKG